jgi:hypothetical protein
MKTLCGMPEKTVRAMLRSPKTPKRLKQAWRLKLKKMGV